MTICMAKYVSTTFEASVDARPDDTKITTLVEGLYETKRSTKWTYSKA
jgi:hypothetical protein